VTVARTALLGGHVSGRSAPALLAVSVAVLAVQGAAIWLWAEFGAAVFFETIRSGFIACFG